MDNVNVTNEKSALVGNVSLNSEPKEEPYYDLSYDQEFNKLLDEVNEELSLKNVHMSLKNNDFFIQSIPDWYQDMSKIEEAKNRLEKLSNHTSAASPSTAAHIKRIEEDHGTPFCKMNYPRYPSLNKSWTNSWKLYCTIKRKDIESALNQSHKTNRQCLVVEGGNERVSLESQHTIDYPSHLVDAVKLFEDFAMELIKEKLVTTYLWDAGTIYDKNMWNSIELFVRSNHVNELIIVVRGTNISVLIPHLRKYFQYDPGNNSKFISIICIDTNWTIQQQRIGDSITNTTELQDKLGPLLMHYNLMNIQFDFNSIETMQLNEIIEDYLGLTKQTTLLHLGCSFGVLSLIMSYKCKKVIGLNLESGINELFGEAERLKSLNQIDNVSFIECQSENFFITCSPFAENCITVAVLNLSSNYGKCQYVMQGLRDMPSVWRVLIYGPFTEEFKEHIAMLTTEDDTMGERFLPIQGCILDKSITVVEDFHIIILFERKSLIAPKIELLAPGPTLNVIDFQAESSLVDNLSLIDSDEDYDLDSRENDDKCENSEEYFRDELAAPGPTLNVKDIQPESSLVDDLSLIDSDEDYDTDYRKNDDMFENSEEDSKLHNDQSDFPKPLLSTRKGFCFNCSPPPTKRFSSSPILQQPSQLSNEGFQFNYPPPPVQRFSRTSPFSDPSPNLFRNEFQCNYPPSLTQRFPTEPFISYTQPSVQSEFQVNYPPQRFSIPTNFSQNSQAVNQFHDPLPKLQRLLNESAFPSQSHLLAPINPPLPIEKYPTPPPPPPPPLLEEIISTTEESKHVSSSKSFHETVSIINEPEDMDISPNTSDIENMDSPVHKPRAHDDHRFFQPLTAHEAFKVNDPDFPVQANLSYLGMKLEVKSQKSIFDIEKDIREIIDLDEKTEISCEKNENQKNEELESKIFANNMINSSQKRYENLNTSLPTVRNYKRQPSNSDPARKHNCSPSFDYEEGASNIKRSRRLSDRMKDIMTEDNVIANILMRKK